MPVNLASLSRPKPFLHPLPVGQLEFRYPPSEFPLRGLDSATLRGAAPSKPKSSTAGGGSAHQASSARARQPSGLSVRAGLPSDWVLPPPPREWSPAVLQTSSYATTNSVFCFSFIFALSSSNGPNSRHMDWQCCTQVGTLPKPRRVAQVSHCLVGMGR